jgi:hypothetical protein
MAVVGRFLIEGEQEMGWGGVWARDHEKEKGGGTDTRRGGGGTGRRQRPGRGGARRHGRGTCARRGLVQGGREWTGPRRKDVLPSGPEPT